MTQNVLSTEALGKRYGGLVVTDNVHLAIAPGELHAVIGPNGAGKSTLINQLSGEIAPDSGKILYEGQDITGLLIHQRARNGLLRSYQITSIFEDFTVRENVVLAALGAREHAFRFWEAMLRRTQFARQADEVLQVTGLAANVDTLAHDLSYGGRRQLELAMALAARPTMLLLDEPMAGMSVQESAAVVSLLQNLKRRYTILLVEHDMDAVFALADRITVLVYGKIIFTGTPEQVRSHPEVRAAYLGDATH